MNYLDYFHSLSLPEQKYEFLRFSRLAQTKQLKTIDVVNLLIIANNERYFDYIPNITKILFIGGPFHNVIIFNKLLDFYLTNYKSLDLNIKSIIQESIIMREINVANSLQLKQYKRVLELKGIKTGKIADNMVRRGIRLKGYRGLTESAIRRTRPNVYLHKPKLKP